MNSVPGLSTAVAAPGRAWSMTNRDEPQNPAPLSRRLDQLFKAMRKRDGREQTYREVADAITATGVPISHSYIYMLRTGERDNPTIKHLDALAKHFGVPTSYFIDDDTSMIDRQLDQVAQLQQLKVRALALRQIGGVDGLSEIIELIQQLANGDAPPADADEQG
jgi:transcriptional regulator with XRE-family HTH domain